MFSGLFGNTTATVMVQSTSKKPSLHDLVDNLLFSFETNDKEAVKLIMANKDDMGKIKPELDGMLQLIRGIEAKNDKYTSGFLNGGYVVATRIIKTYLIVFMSEDPEMLNFLTQALPLSEQQLKGMAYARRLSTHFAYEVCGYLREAGLHRGLDTVPDMPESTEANKCIDLISSGYMPKKDSEVNFSAHLKFDFLMKLKKSTKSHLEQSKSSPLSHLQKLAEELKKCPHYSSKNAPFIDAIFNSVSTILSHVVGESPAMRPSNRPQNIHDFYVKYARQCEQLRKAENQHIKKSGHTP